MLSAKGQIPKADKWKTVGHRQKTKSSFEYHHRSINEKLNGCEKGFNSKKYGQGHKQRHREAQNKRLIFQFDFSDQEPKIFKHLTVQLPLYWSGYELKWYFVSEIGEIQINEPANEFDQEMKIETFDLLKYLPRNLYRFELKVKFTQKVYKRRAKDVNLLLLDYQMVSSIDLNHDQYQLELADGSIKVSKDVIKNFAPSIEMMIQNTQQPSQVIDLTSSPLSAQHIELLSDFSKKSFEEIQLELQDTSAEELADLLLVLSYLMSPKEYFDAVTDLLISKLTLKNGCFILKKIPKEVISKPYRAQLNEKYKRILLDKFDTTDLDDIFETVCQKDVTI